MRFPGLLFAFALICSATLFAEVQTPDKALCSVCVLRGGETEQEKVRAHSEHAGKAYYFCSVECKKEFDFDPVAYLPPVLPRLAPAFAVEMLKGGDRRLEDLREKVVLVDFWATWCTPCTKIMPRLQKLYNAHAGKGFEVLGVSIDEGKDRLRKIGRTLKKLDVAYPIALDAKQTPAWHMFKVKGLPAMYLLDSDGQIVAQWTGEIDLSAVEAEVVRRLGEHVEADRK